MWDFEIVDRDDDGVSIVFRPRLFQFFDQFVEFAVIADMRAAHDDFLLGFSAIAPKQGYVLSRSSKFLLCFPAVIANGVSHNRPVLLLDMRLIVFLVWARTGKSDLLIQAVAVQQIVDELTAIIRIDAEQRKRQSLAHPVDCFRNRLLASGAAGR